MSGCNRVPGVKKKPKASASALIVKTIKSADPALAEAVVSNPTTAPAGEPVNEPPPTPEDLCERACEHWIELRFADPIGIERVKGEHLDNVSQILKRQREHNRTGCLNACKADLDPERALCILRAGTPEDCHLCASLSD